MNKFIVIVTIVGILMIQAVTGYYIGICHVVRYSKASYQAGVVTLELDGQVYKYFVERWNP